MKKEMDREKKIFLSNIIKSRFDECFNLFDLLFKENSSLNATNTLSIIAGVILNVSDLIKENLPHYYTPTIYQIDLIRSSLEAVLSEIDDLNVSTISETKKRPIEIEFQKKQYPT